MAEDKKHYGGLTIVAGELKLTEIENSEGDFVKINDGKIVSRTTAQVRESLDIPNEVDQNNIVRVLQINAEDLSGEGTIFEQVAEYLNSLTLEIVETTSKLNIEIVGNLPDTENTSFTYTLPLTLS